jgi:glucosylglycerate phosphorylase
MNDNMQTFYTTLLTKIYGTESAAQIELRLQNLLEHYRGRISKPEDASLSERDSLLITYGDQVQEKGKAHLQTLRNFAKPN